MSPQYANPDHRDRLFHVLKQVDAAGVKARNPKTQQKYNHRGEFITPGPNYLWSIDGYMKLQHFGFEIYAAIDAYSRFVIWGYVGTSARTNISVARMYYDTVSDLNFIPQILRSDRGSETIMIADMHYQLSDISRGSPEQPLGFSEAFLFGTSVANQRIEAWWNQLSKSSMRIWKVGSTCTLQWLYIYN